MKVHFHLPGIAGHFKFNMVFISMYKNCPEFFREGVEIASIYGAFPQSLWNGGRITDGLCDRKFVKSALDSFNGQGIPVRFTFTNPALEKKHLNDKFCNMVLSLANNGMNEVIVVSPILEDYIRKYYPQYKLTSSTCKRLNSLDALNAELEKDYHIVVMDYDLNNKFDILGKVSHKDKCEILVNSNCRPNCPDRTLHYHSLGEKQIAAANHLRKYPNSTFDTRVFGDGYTQNCPYCSRDLFAIRDLPTNVKPDDIWDKYVPMGFNQFKIEGRTANLYNLMETYIYYMIKPEQADYARYMFLRNLTSNGVITINE